jgi:flagellin-like protein
MATTDRGVTSVVSTILLVAIVLVLGVTISVYSLDITDDLNEPAPNVAETSAEFVPGGGTDEQVVRTTHIAGDRVAIKDLEIIVRASGPDVDTQARLVDLPSTASSRLLDENIEGDEDLIDQSPGSARLITDDGVDFWSPGSTIEFRVNSGTADYRDGNTPDADELEVVIVHTPSNSIIIERTFRP